MVWDPNKKLVQDVPPVTIQPVVTPPAETPLASQKPSPTSVTGQPKTNDNNSISGSIPNSTVQTVGATPAESTSNNQFALGTNMAGSVVKQADGSDYSLKGASAGGTPVNTAEHPIGPNSSPTPSLNTPSPTAGSNTGTTNVPSGTIVDDQAAALKAANDEQVGGLNNMRADLEAGRVSDTELINQQYLAQQAELERSLNVLNTLHEQNLSSIDAATSASQVANDNAVKKQEAATKLAQQQVDQKYLELKAAQKLANKRVEIQKETALGVLGGSFTSAGVADITDTILQGEQALTSLGLSNISQDTAFINDLNAFYDDYRQKNLEIQSNKVSQVNQSYANLQTSIASIQASKLMSSEERTQAIIEAGRYYNSQVATINDQIIHAKYDLATNVSARADALKAQAATSAKDATTAANLERDDARNAIQNIIATYPAASFAAMSDAQKKQMQALELKAGYPQGMVEQGISTMKETLNDAKINQLNVASDQKQQLIDLKAKSAKNVHWFTDDNGVATVAVYDLVTGEKSTYSMGQISGSQAEFQPVPDASGNIIGFNRKTGKTQNTTVDPSVNQGVVGAEGDKGNVQDALQVPDRTKAGQCGHFVNDYLGKRIIPDSYADKLAQTNSNTPQVGAVFVMPTTLHDGTPSPNGHTGFVKTVGTNPETGKPGVEVKDSNWGEDGRVQTHWFDQSRITGYISPTTTSNSSSTPSQPKSVLGSAMDWLTGGTPATRADKIAALKKQDKTIGNAKANSYYENLSDREMDSQYGDYMKSKSVDSQTNEAKLKKAQQDSLSAIDSLN